MKYSISIKMRLYRRKPMAYVMLIAFLFNILAPYSSFALTSGPTQPEVQGFEPVGTSDMVDLFSGDFSYNVPLLDVDGYPINISYHAGITMDQEASWTGLGWNVNAGVINRNVRGIPDDFDGDPITKRFSMKDNTTYGIDFGVGAELFGLQFLSIDYTLGLKFNNYTGIGAEQSVNLSINSASNGKGPLTGSLGLTSSSDEGVTIGPSVSFSATISNTDKMSSSLGISVGSSFNTRQGLKGLTIGATLSASANESKTDAYGKAQDLKNGGGIRGGASYNFGQATYMPRVEMPMKTVSLTGRFKIGLDFIGAHPHFSIGGYYSNQYLKTNEQTNRAYGYLNLDDGAPLDDCLLDFNREKDGVYTESTPSLPLPISTFDTYSVSGQGAGGSYRPYRGDLGYLFDARSGTSSVGASIGAEVGVGNIAKIGIDLNATVSTTTSGKWGDDNFAKQRMRYHSTSNDPLYEKVYFKEANEKGVNSDPAFYEKMGGFDPHAIALKSNAYYYTLADERFDNGQAMSAENFRSKREHRNQEIAMLSKKEAATFGLDHPDSLHLCSQARDWHIGQVTSYSTDGRRYVYGIPAYNTDQHEVTFSVDHVSGNPAMVSYNNTIDNTPGNKKGTDNYFNEVITPPFAHAYMLTAVLSADYVDADNIRGPSAGDLGNYTKFSYVKVEGYNWRTPYDRDMASHNEGLKSNEGDDKANYVAGTKDLYFLKKIETKNYVAIFELQDRADARGVQDQNGGLSTASNNTSKLLRSITLYSKPDFDHQSNPLPIKKVNFVYDYSLCRGISNFDNSAGGYDRIIKEDSTVNTNGGKLTLRGIYFTYQNSQKGRLSPYVFNYNTLNPNYTPKAMDRWGNYKNSNGTCTASFSDFPYVTQDSTNANTVTRAWTLNEIELPSGGKINIDFESDDYAFVQDKVASQMFVIKSTSSSALTNQFSGNNEFYFDLQKKDPTNYDTEISHYGAPGDLIYFRFLVKMDVNNDYEYIPGYAEIEDIKVDPGNAAQGYVRFKAVNLDGASSSSVSPVLKTAIQFGRANTPKLMWSQPTNTNMSFGKQLLTALMESYHVIGEMAHGPNTNTFGGSTGHCKSFVLNESWVRLKNPIRKKLGGGCRVKKIEMHDEWDLMASSGSGSSYGQEYQYTLADGSSSGVAAYEPQLGGEENSLRMPFYYNEEKLMVPDESHYVEMPFGEGLYPGASVGYSRVTVTNLQYANVHSHATGKVVHEFYTAKDFPTISRKTDIIPVRHKTDPWSFSSFLHIDSRDYMTASQGYSVEVNDMHGKPRAQMVYAEDQDKPITSIEYHYQQSPYGAGSARLENNATVIFNDGTVGQRDIGVNVDMVSDFRESKTSSISAGINLNLDIFTVFIPPIVTVPSAFPSFSQDRVQFRSAVTTKLIQRFGILEETVAKDLGSVVTTKNVAYDAESGDVLLTQTTQDFNDPVYAFTYPAHWYYDGMAPASRNEGAIMQNVGIGSSGFTMSDARSVFIAGDELALQGSSSSIKAWVSNVTANKVTLIDKIGDPITGGPYNIKIIHSGHRNQQSLPMAQITSLMDPLQSISSNAYSKVIQASAIEYTNGWKTFCDCFINGTSPSQNPYVIGTKGYWKPKKSYLHLTDRSQTKYDNNTNIRKDGVFTAYTPFYKLTAGKWVMDFPNWTYTSEVTEFSPFGPELENKDALGKYSAATFGFNQTLATSVSANARYRDIGSESFEDYGFSTCADNHFKISPPSAALSKLVKISHTGRYSLEVASTDSVVIARQLKDVCDVPADCDVSLCYQVDSATGVIRIKAEHTTTSSGSNQFSIDWDITGGFGSKNVVLIPNGIEITTPITAGETFTLDLVFGFSDNCTVRKHMTISKSQGGSLNVGGLSTCRINY
jgi:hypothetical protein